MMSLMKHVRLLVLIGLSLHSVNMVAGEWSPDSQVKGIAEGGSLAMEKLFDTIKNNPALLLAPVAAGGLLFVGKRIISTEGRIYNFCCTTCNNVQTTLTANCASAQKTFGTCASTCINVIPMPGIVRGALATILQYMFGGIANYASHNKKFAAGALLLHVVGRVLAQQTPCNMASGGTLTLGYFKGVLDRHHQANMIEHDKTRGQLTVLQNGQDVLKAEVEGQGEATRLQAEKNKQEVLSKLGQETAALSAKVQQVQSAITAQVSTLDTNLNNKIDVAVIFLSDRLQGITKEILELAGRFDELHKDSIQKDQTSQKLLLQLEKANNDLVSTKESFDSFVKHVMAQMTDLAESTAKQLTEMQSQANSQGESLEQVQEKVDQLLQEATNNNQLLESVQKIQQENNQQLINLSEIVNKTSADDAAKFKFLETMLASQEASTLSLTTQMSALSSAQSNVEGSIGNLFPKIESMEQELLGVKTGLAEVKEGSLAIVKKMDSNQNDTKLKYKKLKEENKKLNQSIVHLRVEHAENIGKLRQDLYNVAKVIKDQNDETQRLVKQTNSMVGSAIQALPEPIGNSVPLVPGYNVPAAPLGQLFLTKSMQQDYFLTKFPAALFSFKNLPAEQQLMLAVIAGTAAQSNQRHNVMQITSSWPLLPKQ